MSAETVLYATLSADAGVTAIVGVGADSRIYPDVVPQEIELPAIAYARADTEYTSTVHAAAPVLERTTLAIWIMAEKRADADALADAVLTAATAQQFTPISRRADFDADNEIWVTELGVTYWE